MDQAIVTSNSPGGKSVQLGSDRCLDAAEVGYGLGVTNRCSLEGCKVVTDLEQLTNEGDECLRDRSNLEVLSGEVCVDGIAEVGQMVSRKPTSDLSSAVTPTTGE